MRETFIGDPTKEEIDIYLMQKDYSLVNMTELRSDIMSINSDKSKELCKNFFQDTFPEEKDGLLQDKTNKPLRFFYEGKDLKRKMEKSILKHPRKGKFDTKALKKLTTKNTQKNSGYKYVKLQYRVKKIYFDSKEKERSMGSLRTGRIKWSLEKPCEPHNTDKVKPILKASKKAMNEIKHKKKVKVVVETKTILSNFGMEADFQYSVNK